MKSENLHSNFTASTATQQRISVLVFRQNGEPVGEYVARIKADTEQDAVDLFKRHARIDLNYRFLGMHGEITPSTL